MTSGVYSLECPCGLKYIGGSKDIEDRYNQHRSEFNLGKEYKRHSHFRDCSQCGDFDKVQHNILEECSVENIDSREDYYVTLYDSVTNGLNDRGGGVRGNLTESHKNQISESLTGRVLPEETKKKMSDKQSGEGNGNSKVTEELVRLIKIDYKNGTKPMSIYKKYRNEYPQLTHHNVYSIVRGITWRNIVV